MLDPVERIYNILHLLRDGCIRDGGGVLPEDRDWFAIPLSPAQFKAFEDKLEATGEYSAEGGGYAGVKGYYGDKVRWDYDPTFKGGEYVIRQSTPRHGGFVEEVKKALEGELRRVVDIVLTNSDGETTATIQPLVKMWFRTRATVELLLGNNTTVYRSPDVMFTTNLALPTLIVECVVGININGNETATISVWRRSMEALEGGRKSWALRCDVDAVPFRSVNGETCKGELELSLADVVQDAYSARHSGKPFVNLSMHKVAITFATLADHLTEVEARVEQWKAEEEKWMADCDAEASNNSGRDDYQVVGSPNDDDDDSDDSGEFESFEIFEEHCQAKLSRELRDAEENLKLDAYFELEKLEVEREAEEKRQKETAQSNATS
ncbi:hypothetical protein LTR17_014227 [Elasticomyces elasticus]|nr:hypothetical protein LTR17_014227 [Elasticomyces elasticus]